MNRQPGKPTVTLKNWYYTGGSLSGNVFGHPRFEDGTYVTTSTVQSILKDAPDVFLLETMNTNYLIEPPPHEMRREQFVGLPVKEN